MIRSAYIWSWCYVLSAQFVNFLTANGIGVIPKFISEGLFYGTFRYRARVLPNSRSAFGAVDDR